MSAESHYQTLDVPETASIDEIKKAYRKLSLKYHPDKNLGKPEVAEIFHKINNSYEVLGDQNKKNEYDMMRKNPFANMMRGGGGGGGGSMGPHFGPNIDEIFANMFFGGMGGGGMPGMFPPNGSFQIFRNGVPVNMTANQIQKPVPIIKTLTINMEQVLNGGSFPMEIERWILENGNKKMETQTIYVTIMKGIDNNEIIVLENQGKIVNEQCKGDIKIFIKIDNNTEFQRRGLDLILEKNISLKEALCGFSFELKYINGKDYTIHNPSGNTIPFGHHKIIPNMGLMRDEHVGNMIIVFTIGLPTSLTEEQIAGLSKLL